MMGGKDTGDVVVDRLNAGDVAEFEKLYRKYARRVYWYVVKKIGNSEDGEEIVQEVFAAIWEKRSDIRSEGVVWIAARHKCIDKLRKRQMPTVDADSMEIAACQEDDGDMRGRAREWLRLLGAGEQEVLALLLDGHSRKDIAQKLCLPMGTVDARLHRLKKKIAKGDRE